MSDVISPMLRTLLPSALLLLPLLPATAAPDVRSVMGQYCTDCHDGDVKKGGLDLTSLAWNPESRENFDEWVKVFDRVTRGEMPPAKKPQLAANERTAFLGQVEKTLVAHQAAEQAKTGRTILRRLNRMEYEQTVQDLLGITAPLANVLPEDTPLHGFDTVAEGLRFSQLQMEKYLEAADLALDEAIRLDLQPEMLKKRLFFKDEASVRKNIDTPVGTVTDKYNPKNTHRHLLKQLPDDAIAYFNEGYPPAELRQFNPRTGGTYRLRISGYGFQTGGRPVAMQVYGNNFREKRLLGWFEMPADKARVVEITAMIRPNEHLLIQPADVGVDAKGQGVYNIGADAYTGSGLALQWVDVEGPLQETWPAPSLKKLFGDTPITTLDVKKQKRMNNRIIGYELTPQDPAQSVRPLLVNFATRAFRRPLQANEAEPFVQLVEAEFKRGAKFVDAMRVGFAAILTSPQFLLFEETPGKLDAYALASRLSYFLWSSAPDAELLTLAANQKLAQKDVLDAQVERLLDSPKAVNFVKNFTGQWLELRNIQATTPDKKLYPEFDDLLELSMVAETEAFFSEMLKKDLPVRNLIHSDFAMLNGRMASHYKIDGISGEAFQRVSLTKDSPRGGVLTQASVLKVTANGTTTSPVLRGAWVMKHLLGQPPSPPPANVGSIEPDTRGATTIREQLAKHRNSESCAGCHANIDPPGFALESFDVIGGFRDRYRSQDQGDRINARSPGGRYYQYRVSLPVDASGQLPDGRAFSGLAEYKTLLMDQQDQVLTALTKNLITYGTGAGIQFADRQAIAAIAEQTKQQGGGLRTLIHQIVQSSLFQTK